MNPNTMLVCLTAFICTVVLSVGLVAMAYYSH